jgi:two-component system, chemotaxis family, protein-glutamate methylesterase/glutaminase
MTIRTLVIDDSATMRALISSLLQRDPEIEVVGTAHNPLVARQMIKELNPDVLTLDVEMPEMNGLDFLEKLMRLRPMPVIMVSTLTQKGAEATLRALELGAVDCYAKPTGDIREILCTDDGRLTKLVRTAAFRRHRISGGVANKAAAPPKEFEPNDKIVAIGSSTGGVEALMQLVRTLPANCPPIVIVQHMPGTFTRALAQRLNNVTAAEVVEAKDGDTLSAGKIYVAPGGDAHVLIRGNGAAKLKMMQANPVSGHRPSVDVLFRSAAQACPDRTIGVILTGMGADGASGMLELQQAGGRTIGQDEASCVVYGMPRAAAELGALSEVLPIHKIGPRIIELCSA